jgi:hypothetical protein
MMVSHSRPLKGDSPYADRLSFLPDILETISINLNRETRIRSHAIMNRKADLIEIDF